MNVTLRTSEWQSQIEEELKLCRPNTEALYNPTTNSLLGEDFSIPSLSFEDGKHTLKINMIFNC